MHLPNAYALIIGITQYQHVPPLPEVADAEDVAGVLRDPTACGYPPNNVTVLREDETSREHILGAIDELITNAGTHSTALFYFSGHGGRDSGNESYLIPIDGDCRSPERRETTLISSRVLGDKLAAIQAARLLVILDCCHAADLAHTRDVHSSTWTPQLADDALGRLARGHGRVVMAASRGDGASHVMANARHGLFTEHLIAGLRGAAGRGDGLVRVLDLYDHIQRNVVARYPTQRPVLKAETEDNFPVGLCTVAPALSPPRRSDFAYDALVVAALDERDRAWAMATLVSRLEERGLRICVETRDAELSSVRVREIERLVASSRFTVPVLTPRFSAGRFEELQTFMALHLGVEQGMARLIPIVREPCEASLAVRLFVHLDMSRDENVVPGVERLIRRLEQ
jgi:hypothetical protein